jgi:hypothetical protein
MRDDERKAWAKGAGGAKAIGAYVSRMLDPVARARGFATTAILSEWPAVVGEELAGFTAPDKLVWPRRNEDREAASPQSAWRADGAILVVKVDGPRAIELQHRTEQILERVNAYFGYRAVAQLRFIQAPLPKAKVTAGPQEQEPSDAGKPVVGVAPDAKSGLAEALGRLGAGVHGKITRR